MQHEAARPAGEDPSRHHDVPRRVATKEWALDIAVAYVGGFFIGAPLGLCGLWLTGEFTPMVVAIPGVMVALLLSRRVARTRRWLSSIESEMDVRNGRRVLPFHRNGPRRGP